jgi:hypothetical protein
MKRYLLNADLDFTARTDTDVVIIGSGIAGLYTALCLDPSIRCVVLNKDGEYVEITGIPTMREDMVRIGMGTSDVRYRGEFNPWEATFTVKYNANVFSAEQIINLFNLGGFACGIGEWRAEKGGSYGMYHVK